MEREPLGLSLGLRTPRLPATHAEAGTVLCALDRNYTVDISRTSFGVVHCSRATSCRTTWFNHDTAHDYRIDNDPPPATRLAALPASPYFGGAGDMADPVVPPPLALTKPAGTGVAQV